MTKAQALKALEERKKNKPERVDNSRLHAGSPMYYYCRECGHASDVLPETHTSIPRKFCWSCQDMKDKGWI